MLKFRLLALLDTSAWAFKGRVCAYSISASISCVGSVVYCSIRSGRNILFCHALIISHFLDFVEVLNKFN